MAMITVFNRREVYCGFSMQEQARVRDILAQNGVRYYTRVINQLIPGTFINTRAEIGSFGDNVNYMYQYYIYVHKKDYEKARGLIG